MEQNQTSSSLDFLRNFAEHGGYGSLSEQDKDLLFRAMCKTLCDLSENYTKTSDAMKTLSDNVAAFAKKTETAMSNADKNNQWSKSVDEKLNDIIEKQNVTEIMNTLDVDICSDTMTQSDLCYLTEKHTSDVLNLTNDCSVQVFVRDTKDNCYAYDENNDKKFIENKSDFLAEHMLSSKGRITLTSDMPEYKTIENNDILLDHKRHMTLVPINYQKQIERGDGRTQSVNMGYMMIHHENELSSKEETRINNIIAKERNCFKSQYYENATEQVHTKDPLTQLDGNHKIPEIMSEHVGYAVKNGQPVTFAHIDADDFKNWNNKWNHAVGDEVLKKIANAIGEKRRYDDISYDFTNTELQRKDDKKLFAIRTGGDEFVLIGVGYNETDMSKRLVDSCVHLRQNGQVLPDGSVEPIGISAGVYEMTDEQKARIQNIGNRNITDMDKKKIFADEFNKAKHIADEREIRGKQEGKGVVVNSMDTIRIKNIVNEKTEPYSGPERRNQPKPEVKQPDPTPSPASYDSTLYKAAASNSLNQNKNNNDANKTNGLNLDDYDPSK